MANQDLRSADEAAFNDPALAELAAAILDGTPVDWNAVALQVNAPDEALLRQLRVLADVGVLHRSLPISEGGSTGTADEPALAGGIGRWGSLTLLERIGMGAFGEVFRARDDELHREVALKLLYPPRDAATASPLTEGRLLARVRHPNVVTVHGGAQHDGRMGLWMEFVRGRTLAAIVREESHLQVADVVRIGVTLCEALTAVHASGLLHRDVKPQNVMIENDGRVVLMDFGAGRDRSMPVTDVAGTPLYLAPELFKGGQPSIQTDVYSLGVLLFHLLTGTYPVTASSIGNLRAAHQSGDRQSLLSVRSDVPAPVAAVIERAIAPSRANRFKTPAAMADALRNSIPHAHPRERPTANRWLMVGFGTVLLAGVLAGLAALQPWRSSPRPAPTSAPAFTVETVTTTGDASLGVISPSGQFVAYVRGRQTLWVRTVSTGADVQLVPAQAGRLFLSLSVEPDDAHVDFVTQESAPLEYALWRVPIRGGPVEKIATNVGSGIGWSPDGRRMAFVGQSPAKSYADGELMIADAGGLHLRSLGPHPPPGAFLTNGFVDRAPNRPVWSPDGTTIALLSVASSEIVLVDADTGRPRKLLNIDKTSISAVAWLHNTSLLVDRHDTTLAPSELWTTDVRTGESVPLTRDVSDYLGVSTTADGQTAASTRTERRAGVWIGGPSGESMTAVVAESSAGARKWISLDNYGDLAVSTLIGSEQSIRMFRSTPAPVEHTSIRGLWPSVTPDGTAMVFGNDDRTAGGLFRVGMDGSGPTQIVEGDAHWPKIAPDGQTVFFVSTRSSGVPSVWSVPLTGGVPRQVAHRFTGRNALVFPDSRHVAMMSSASDGQRIVVICDLPACHEPRELRLPFLDSNAGAPWQLTPDGHGIAVVHQEAPQNIWVQPLDGGQPRQLTRFTDREITAFSWSPDGKRLALVRATNLSDIVLLKGLK